MTIFFILLNVDDLPLQVRSVASVRESHPPHMNISSIEFSIMSYALEAFMEGLLEGRTKPKSIKKVQTA